MHRGEPPHVVLFGDVDQTQVGEERHAQPADLFEALGIVERRRRAPCSSRRRIAAPPRRGGARRSPPRRRGTGERCRARCRLARRCRRAATPRSRRSARLRCARRPSRPPRRPDSGAHRHDDAAPQRRRERRQDRVECAVVTVGLEREVVESDRSVTRERAPRAAARRAADRRADRLARAPARTSRARRSGELGSSVSSRRNAPIDAPVSLRAGAGDGLHHPLGVELGDERLADVAQDLRDGDDASRARPARAAVRVDVEREADDSGDLARRRRTAANLIACTSIAGAVAPFDAEVDLPSVRPSSTSCAISASWLGRERLLGEEHWRRCRRARRGRGRTGLSQ